VTSSPPAQDDPPTGPPTGRQADPAIPPAIPTSTPPTPAPAPAAEPLVDLPWTGVAPTLPMPWGDESAVVSAVLDWATRRVARTSDPKSTARPAEELKAATGPTVTPAGIGAERALHLFDEVLVPATRAQDDAMMLAYVPSAPTRAAVAFEFATSAANIFGGLWESGAGAIHAENQVIAWLVELLGWPVTAGGCFVAGGTMGNLSALVAARHTAQSSAALTGAVPASPDDAAAVRWQVACTAEAHSSIRSAARVMGVDVLEVPEDADGRLSGPALAERLQRQDERRRVFAVVASAGTTNAGIVDDLAGVARICARYGVWLHVDGAYGGAALAAPSVRDRFSGIERADSFIVDPHKWLFAPYDCCALVYRRPELARAAHTQRASYLDEVDHTDWNPADLAVHLTRRPRGLPLWFSLAAHGTRRYTEAVERSLWCARQVADAIRARPFLHLVQEPVLSVLLFERIGWQEADYRRWSRAHALAGTMLCVPTRWQGRSVLRLVFVNPGTDPDAVVAVLDTLAR
jgi:glutamate/tyrosine decarboxylase-like PLP-dependent enzyme